MSYSVKRPRCKQFFRVMRITTLLLFVFIFCMHAENSSSQNVNVTIKRSNTELENVLNDIEKQTDYLFIYNKFVNVDRKVSVNLKKASLEEVLANLFAGTDVKYSVDGSYILLSAGGTTTTISLSAQQGKMVSGVITDINGEPIIGANVIEKDSESVGTVTDVDGKFTLALDKPAATLVVSYIGYLTKEVPVGSQSVLKIILSEDTQNLEEVVVIGYGTAKKKDLTGAISRVKAEKMEVEAPRSVQDLLRASAAGLSISMSTDAAGTADLQVRGKNSLKAGSSPLLVLDGVIYDGSLQDINPMDIESIDVLKDASSVAVYGAKAANGVVAITTKKGKKGEKVTFNYNNNFSWSAPSRMAKGLPADQWLRAMNVESNNTSGTQYWSDELIAAVEERMKDPSLPTAWENTQGNKFTANGEWAYAGNTDWLDVLFNDAAFMQQHNASVRGGSEKISYYGSVGYKGQDGLLAYGTDHFKRINMSFNFNTQLTNWLEIGLNVKYNRSEANEPNSNFYTSEDPYYEVYRSMPFIPVYLPDGDFAGVAGSNFNFNIAGMLAQAGRTKNVYDDIWYTGSFKLTPFKDYLPEAARWHFNVKRRPERCFTEEV